MGDRGRRAGRPTDYDWELGRGSIVGVPSATITQFEVFVADSAETLVRLRGEVLTWLDISDSVAGDVLVVAWGVIRAPSGSSDVGVSPLTEGGANWVAYGVTHLATEVAVGTAGDANVDGLQHMRFAVDSKAMRKLREDESIYVIAETQNVVGSPVSNFAFALRALAGR